MSTIKYKLYRWGLDIEKAEITRETKCYVFLKGRCQDIQEEKRTESHVYYDTLEEAQNSALRINKRKIENTRKELGRLLNLQKRLESEHVNPDKYAEIRSMSSSDRQEIHKFALEKSQEILRGEEDKHEN